jgi:putative membrane protein
MLRSFIIRLIINAIALYVTASILPGITLRDDSVGTLLLIALVFGIVNAIVKPITTLLTCPMIILTLGLFSLVINALMLLLTSALLGAETFHIDGFWTALLAGIVMAIVAMIAEWVLGQVGLNDD